MPSSTEQVYQAFLLRCSLIPPEGVGEPAVWRFELQEVAAESRRHWFSDFALLQAFVAGRLTAVAGHNGESDPPELP